MEYPTVEAKGSKTLIEAFDQWLEVKPDKVYACVPESSNINDGLRFVTMREMACAIDSFAWALTEQYGRSDRFETIAYCGVNDLRYPVVFFALIKCGYKVRLKKAHWEIHARDKHRSSLTSTYADLDAVTQEHASTKRHAVASYGL